MTSRSRSEKDDEPPLDVYASGKPRRGRPRLSKVEKDRNEEERRLRKNSTQSARNEMNKCKLEVATRTVDGIYELLKEEGVTLPDFRKQVEKIITDTKNELEKLDDDFKKSHPSARGARAT